jgi:hypothetical protein
MFEARMLEFRAFVVVDMKGRIVWYFNTEGSSWAWTRRSNGNFVFNDVVNGLQEDDQVGNETSLDRTDQATHRWSVGYITATIERPPNREFEAQ